MVLGTKNANHLAIRTNNNNRIFIESGGNVGVNTATPKSGIEMNTSVAYAVNSISANYSLTTTDKVVIATSAITASLPSAVGIKGRVYTIKNASSGSVTVNSSGGNIDGSASVSIAASKYIEVISDGTNWYIIGSN